MTLADCKKYGGQINYSEFLAATMSDKGFLNESRLMSLFKEIDHEGNGYLTLSSFRKCLIRLGRPTSMEEVKTAMKEEGFDPISQISFEDFKAIMQKSS